VAISLTVAEDKEVITELLLCMALSVLLGINLCFCKSSNDRCQETSPWDRRPLYKYRFPHLMIFIFRTIFLQQQLRILVIMTILTSGSELISMLLTIPASELSRRFNDQECAICMSEFGPETFLFWMDSRVSRLV